MRRLPAESDIAALSQDQDQAGVRFYVAKLNMWRRAQETDTRRFGWNAADEESDERHVAILTKTFESPTLIPQNANRIFTTVKSTKKQAGIAK